MLGEPAGDRRPDESKTNVLTSASAPWAGISWLFQRKVTPAALPTLTMISREARTVVWAGAIRVSWPWGWPSAVTEIHEVSVARIVSVIVAAAADAISVAGGCAGFGVRERVVTSFLSSSLLALDDFAGVGAGADELFGGVFWFGRVLGAV
jgi:hypothetical protein